MFQFFHPKINLAQLRMVSQEDNEDIFHRNVHKGSL